MSDGPSLPAIAWLDAGGAWKRSQRASGRSRRRRSARFAGEDEEVSWLLTVILVIGSPGARC